MRGRRAGVAAAVLLAIVLAEAPRGFGTSYNPLTPDECPPAATLTPGATVLLFHSGTEESRLALRVGDVLEVTGSRMSGRRETVGRIRVDAAVGALCFRGEVVEGHLQPHDLAPAGPVSFLVITTDAPCRDGGGR